jgi:hypothetical protein
MRHEHFTPSPESTNPNHKFIDAMRILVLLCLVGASATSFNLLRSSMGANQAPQSPDPVTEPQPQPAEDDHYWDGVEIVPNNTPKNPAPTKISEPPKRLKNVDCGIYDEKCPAV